MEYDVAIIGAGPAGTTAATLLARKGWRVVLCEKDNFPKFKIGESLLPHSVRAFDRLGVRDQLEAHAFPKLGGEIATACGQRVQRFYFDGALQLDDRVSYQVERAWFDKMLVEHAAKEGAEIRQPCAIREVDFDATGVTLKTGGGEIRARYLLDCSGRNAVVGQKFDLKKRYDHLQKFSVFAHYEGVQRDEGRDATLTRLVRGRNHWFWFIPLDERRTSVGLVCDLETFRKSGKKPAEMLADAITESALMRERMVSAKPLIDVQAVGDYSYRNTRLHGERWLLAGDAAGFIDPVFSTGVFLAIHSAEEAVQALDAALRGAPFRAWRFASYARGVNRLMNRYLRFVSAWYTEEFVDVFTVPKPPFSLPQAVNSVLGGNIHPNFSVWWRLQLFYLVLWIQHRFPIVPKLEQTLAAPAPSPT